MMNPPGGHGPHAAWSQQSVGSPAGFSSSPHPWSTPSPGYADGDAHGGFNPNITFPHGRPVQRTPSPAFAGVQYPPYTYSPPDYAASPTPPLRRGLYSQASSSSHLGDADATEADMEEIIAAGSTAAAASPAVDVCVQPVPSASGWRRAGRGRVAVAASPLRMVSSQFSLEEINRVNFLLIKCLFYEMCVQCMILVYWCKKYPYFMHVDG